MELFAGIPVADYAAALAWYERLLGRPADFHPHDHEAVFKIDEHAWIYVVADAERAGKALVTFLVDDLDAQIAGLADRGIVAGPVETVAESTRTTVVLDPEGNRLQFGQPG